MLALEPDWPPRMALEKVLRECLPGFAGPLQLRRFEGGQSNPTFALLTPSRRYVLRAKPGPASSLLPSAHAIEREVRVQRALRQHTLVPVPEILLQCEDESVLGRAFYVMEMLDGEVHFDPSLPSFSVVARGALYDAMNEQLARIHALDPKICGLADYGAPGDYYGRQLRRWARQYRQSSEFVAPIDAMERLIEWLPQHAPGQTELRLVHGDYRLDNLLFARGGTAVLGVLDWELSTLGDPLADFAHHLLAWVMPPTLRGMAGANLPALGIPSQEEYTQRYLARSGLKPQASWAFYFGFCLFRLAAIGQGVAARARQGQGSSTNATQQGALARPAAELGWALAQQYQ